MCDYCDCRSHPRIADLSADHEVILGLVGRLRRAAGEADADPPHELLQELGDLLERHTREEEDGVFVQLRRADVDGEYVTRFEQEHTALAQLLADCSGPAWRFHVEHLVHDLGEHIAHEECDLFPAAHQLLRPDQWDAVDAATLTHGPAGGSR